MATGGALIGALRVVLGLDSASFEKGARRSKSTLKNMQRDFTSVGKSLAGAGLALTAGITAPFAALIATSVSAAIESRDAIGQVTAALKSMGPVAGFTAEQLQKMGKDLQNISTFDDDEILRKVTANLLTFGSISGEQFKRAQVAAVDLATRMKTDLQSATILIGKALNDPIRGMAALRRVGIQLTDQQESQVAAMLKAGDVAGAQAIILGELEHQFKGAGQAARDAAPGSAAINKWNDLKEELGGFALDVATKLEPVINRLLDSFNSLSPATKQTILVIAATAAALGPFLTVLGSAVTVVGALLPLIGPLVAGIATLATTIISAAIPAIISLVTALSPILIPLAAVAAAVAGVYLVWRNWDKIAPILKQLYDGAKAWLYEKLGGVFKWLGDRLLAVGQWFYDLYDKVVGHSYVPDMVDGIAFQIARLDGVMVRPIAEATDKVGQDFAALKERLNGILSTLFPEQAEIADLERQLVDIDAALANHFGDPVVWEEARARIIAQMERIRIDLQNRFDNRNEMLLPTASVQESMAALTQNLLEQNDKIFAANDNLKTSFADTAQSIIGSLQGLASSIKQGDFLGVLSGVIDLVSKLGSIGLFGQGFQARINTPSLAGARAAGGPVLPGKSYLVGEKGREIFTPSIPGTIIPNGGSGAPAQITIVPSPYFDARVQGHVTNGIRVAAPQLIASSATAANSYFTRQQNRRLA